MVSFKDKIVEYRKDAQLAEVESGHIESSKKGSKSENNDRANFGSSTSSKQSAIESTVRILFLLRSADLDNFSFTKF